MLPRGASGLQLRSLHLYFGNSVAAGDIIWRTVGFATPRQGGVFAKFPTCSRVSYHRTQLGYKYRERVDENQFVSASPKEKRQRVKHARMLRVLIYLLCTDRRYRYFPNFARFIYECRDSSTFV